VSSAGLVSVMALAGKARLRELADERLSVPTDRGANPGLKISSLVAGMVAGSDSIEDMSPLRHGGMGTAFAAGYAPSRWDGSCARSPSATSAGRRGRLPLPGQSRRAHRPVRLAGLHRHGAGRLDDTIVGYHKQGAAFGYPECGA